MEHPGIVALKEIGVTIKVDQLLGSGEEKELLPAEDGYLGDNFAGAQITFVYPRRSKSIAVYRSMGKGDRQSLVLMGDITRGKGRFVLNVFKLGFRPCMNKGEKTFMIPVDNTACVKVMCCRGSVVRVMDVGFVSRRGRIYFVAQQSSEGVGGVIPQPAEASASPDEKPYFFRMISGGDLNCWWAFHPLLEKLLESGQWTFRKRKAKPARVASPLPEPEVSEGVVLWWSDFMGIGSIAVKAGEARVHWTQIAAEAGVFARLEAGQRVAYDELKRLDDDPGTAFAYEARGVRPA